MIKQVRIYFNKFKKRKNPKNHIYDNDNSKKAEIDK